MQYGVDTLRPLNASLWGWSLATDCCCSASGWRLAIRHLPSGRTWGRKSLASSLQYNETLSTAGLVVKRERGRHAEASLSSTFFLLRYTTLDFITTLCRQPGFLQRIRRRSSCYQHPYRPTPPSDVILPSQPGSLQPATLFSVLSASRHVLLFLVVDHHYPPDAGHVQQRQFCTAPLVKTAGALSTATSSCPRKLPVSAVDPVLPGFSWFSITQATPLDGCLCKFAWPTNCLIALSYLFLLFFFYFFGFIFLFSRSFPRLRSTASPPPRTVFPSSVVSQLARICRMHLPCM